MTNFVANTRVTQVLLKRGNTVRSLNYVGPIGEATMDTDLKTIRIHDGSKPGGWPLLGGYQYAALQANLDAIANVDLSTIANVSTLLVNAISQQNQINTTIANISALSNIDLTQFANLALLTANAASQQQQLDNLVNVGNTDPQTNNETFWFNTDDGRLYLKENNLWVDANPTQLPAPQYIYNQLDSVVGNIIPDESNVYSLGSYESQWKDLWVSNATIYLNRVPLSSISGNLTYNNQPLVSYVDGNLVVGGTVVSVAGGGGSPFTGPVDEGTVVTGVHAGIFGTPRLILASGVSSHNWEIDNSAGNFRVFQPGTVYLSIDSNNKDVNVTNNVNVGKHVNIAGIENDSTPAVDFFTGAANNHKITLAPDWTLKLRARAGGNNEGHLHLAAGNAGTRVQINGNGSTVQVCASDGSQVSWWTFDKTGKLALPGELWAKAGDSYNGITFSPDNSAVYATIKVDTGANMVLNNYQNIYIKRSGAERINITGSEIKLKSQDGTKSWAFNEDGTLVTPNGLKLDLYQTISAGGQSIKIIPNYSGTSYIIVPPDGSGDALSISHTGSVVVTAGSNKQWAFGLDGTANLPQATLGGYDSSAWVQTTGNLRINTNGAIWNFTSPGTGLSQIDFPDGTHQLTAYPGPQDLSGYATTSAVNSAISTAINNLINSAPGTLDTLGEIAANLASEAGAIGAITSSINSINSNVSGIQANVGTFYTWANTNFITTTYNNSNVASYLISKDIVTANLVPLANVTYNLGNLNYQWKSLFLSSTTIYVAGQSLTVSNGNILVDNTQVTNNFGNANVSAYLASRNIASQLQSDYTQSDTGNVTYIKNKPDLSVYATTTALQTLNANVGAYELWANANVSSLQNQITGANTNIQNLSANVGTFYTWANGNFSTTTYSNSNVAAYLLSNPQTGTYSNANATALLSITSINALSDVDTTTVLPITGEVLKWDGTNWVPGSAGGGGGGGISLTDLNAANVSAKNSGYLAYNSITGVFSYAPPDLSGYALNANVTAANLAISNLNANLGAYQLFANANVSSLQNQITGANTNIQNTSANIGTFYTWANSNFSTTTYSNTNTAAYLASQSISAQIQSDWNQATTSNVAYIKNKPDLSVYATTTSLQTLNANLGAYQTWANANVSSLQNQITGANTNIQTLNANLGGFETWANLNFATASGAYSNANVASYLPVYSGNILAGNIITLGVPNTGVYGLDVGIPNPWLPNTIASFGANVNNYTQISLQNLSTGSAATSDYVATADNGNDNINYVDLGIINSGYNTATPNNSLGNIVYAGDSYLYAQGNLSTTKGGNLAIGTTTSTKVLRLFAGGATMSSVVANVSSTGVAVTGNSSATQDLVATGNVYANGGYLRTGATTAYVFNVTPTTVYMSAGATIGTYIGNASGVTQLYGNVQGSTNGFAIGYRDIPQVTLNTNSTLSISDAGKHYYSTSGSYTLTIPSNSNVAFSTGAAINVVNQSTGTITINTQAGVTLYLAGNSTSGANSRSISTYGVATIQKVATDTWFVVGVGLT